MGSMKDLLGDTPYPFSAGFKEPGGTSEEAARQVNAGALQGEVLAVFDRHPEGLTADEVASELGRSILAIRPRVSELRKLGEVVPVARGARKNESGRRARIWKRRPR
jgi:hypothetical protein